MNGHVSDDEPVGEPVGKGDNERIRSSIPDLGAEEREAVRRVLASGRLAGNGPEVQAFEEECAEWLGVAETAAACSGTTALQLALSQFVRPGDVVITSPISFFATVEAIISLGAIPAFCDVNESGQMNAGLAIALMEMMPKATAICPVHMYGDCVAVDRIAYAAKRLNIGVVEDACQAHGAYIGERHAGTWGDYGCLSFYATKHITTLGEGGLVISRDPDRLQNIKAQRNHGMEGDNRHLVTGWNSRMSEAAAAVGRVQLAKFPEVEEKRRWQSYHIWTHIRESAYLDIPAPPANYRHGFFWLPVIMKAAELVHPFRQHLDRLGIETRCRYQEPLYRQPVLAKLFGPDPDYGDLWASVCPRAESLAPRMVGLPTKAPLSWIEIDRIIAAVMSFTG